MSKGTTSQIIYLHSRTFHTRAHAHKNRGMESSIEEGRKSPLITPRKTPRRRSPIVSPRPLARGVSPRNSGSDGSGGSSPSPLSKMDMGKFHKKFMEIRINSKTQDISTKTRDRFTKVIENAMALGQTKAVLGELVHGTHFEQLVDPNDEEEYLRYTGRCARQSTNPICNSRSLRNMWTLQELRDHNDKPVRIVINGQLASVLEWLYKQGVHFCFASAMLKPVGVLFVGPPTLCSKVFLMAVFLPENPNLLDGGPPGTLLSCWNDVRTPKCLDSSMVPTWSERVYKAIRCGIKSVVLSTLRFGDYEEQKQPQQQEQEPYAPLPSHMASYFGSEKAECDPFLCQVGRNHLTMELLTNVSGYNSEAPSWVVDRRFVDMVAWVAQNHWSWTLCFAAEPLESDPTHVRLSRWAYFTVLLDPLDPDNYL